MYVVVVLFLLVVVVVFFICFFGGMLFLILFLITCVCLSLCFIIFYSVLICDWNIALSDSLSFYM